MYDMRLNVVENQSSTRSRCTITYCYFHSCVPFEFVNISFFLQKRSWSKRIRWVRTKVYCHILQVLALSAPTRVLGCTHNTMSLKSCSTRLRLLGCRHDLWCAFCLLWHVFILKRICYFGNGSQEWSRQFCICGLSWRCQWHIISRGWHFDLSTYLTAERMKSFHYARYLDSSQNKSKAACSCVGGPVLQHCLFRPRILWNNILWVFSRSLQGYRLFES